MQEKKIELWIAIVGLATALVTLVSVIAQAL
jgi:hypothetical protein